MAAATRGKSLCTLGQAFHQRLNIGCNQFFGSLLQIRNYAARKGTRERMRKKKVKVEVKKVGFIPHNLRFKKSISIPITVLKQDDSAKPISYDDVWIKEYHRSKVFSFAEAVECHREIHHPTIYNLPTSTLFAFVHLDMEGSKPKTTVEQFQRSVDVPCPFDHGEVRHVIAFSKNSELLSLADKAGASLSGGTDLISKIQTGQVSVNDYYSSVAHPDIMVELSVIRGLMKRKFPNPRLGTLGLDLPSMIHRIKNSIKYSGEPHPQQPLFGTVEAPIGRLNMSLEDLEKNLIAILEDIEKARPKRPGSFLTKVFLKSPPSTELIQVEFEKYFENEDKSDTSYDSDEEEQPISNAI